VIDVAHLENFPTTGGILALKKFLVVGRCVREVPREFEPWIFLVPPILVK
jgi:hypothetical protein